MKSAVVACVLVLFQAISQSSALPQRATGNCAFGQEYNDGCNHCICHGSSGSTCTRLPNCNATDRRISSGGPDSPESPDMSVINRAVQRGHCSMGLEFQKDCNICTCQGELGYICTKKECSTSYNMGDRKAIIGTGADIPESPSTPPTTTEPGRCILGHRFFNGCNLCVCYGEFFGYRCARMENCREQRVPVTYATTKMPMMYQKQTGTCPQGETYNDGYYMCKCRSDLKGYVCTIGIS